MNALDYTGALEDLLRNYPRAESTSPPTAKQDPALTTVRPIAIRDVKAQLALCDKVLGSPVFERIPALVLALQDGRTDMLDTWMNGVYARLDGNGTIAQLAGDCDPHEKGKLLAVLALGMLAGFEHGAQRMTGAVSNLRQVIIAAHLA